MKKRAQTFQFQVCVSMWFGMDADLTFAEKGRPLTSLFCLFVDVVAVDVAVCYPLSQAWTERQVQLYSDKIVYDSYLGNLMPRNVILLSNVTSIRPISKAESSNGATGR